jgi:hypothetical protein
MIYIQQGQVNNLTLNINNNARPVYTSYTLVFTHIMSKFTNSYTVYTNNPQQYIQNIRYCEVTINLQNSDLIYLGQYDLNIYGDGTDNVFIGIAIVDGQNGETTPFIEYISPDETDSNYIYVQE